MLTTEDRAEVQRLIAEAFRSTRFLDTLVDVTARAIEVFGSRERALRWLKTPVRSLDDQSPLSLLDTSEGITRVTDVLGRVEHIRNPKYAHLLLAHVPEAERYIKIDPNAPKAQTSTPDTGAATGFESQNRQPAPNEANSISQPKFTADQSALASQSKVSTVGSESQINHSADELVRIIRETRLRPDREVA